MFLLLVTVSSMLLAAIMSIVAWRIAVHERRRSEARVDALAAEIHAAPASSFQPATPIAYRRDHDLELRPQEANGSDMFGAVHPAASSSRFAAVFGIGVLVLVTAASAALALSAMSRRASAHETAIAQPSPLELVALTHERDGDTLTVRGVVRNPQSSARVDDLTAVVFLFSAEGAFVASGRATVASVALGPGGESTFVVVVPRANDVGRFRVSFRTDDRVVPHVDRRPDGTQ
jgi:hypothetical protein